MSASPAVVVERAVRRFRHAGTTRTALDGVSFTLERGRTLAVVGESGAGKSTLVRLVAGLDEPTSGQVLVDGRPPRLGRGRLSAVQMVFQHPHDSLNPLLPIGASVAEPLLGRPRREVAARVAEALEQVGLDPSRARERPGYFSGGQLQRVVIARALVADPSVLLCDEATSALDVSVQAHIVNLLMELQRSRGFACLFVTHDLGVAKVVADEIAVLHQGAMVERAPVGEFFGSPRAEYSARLLEAVKRTGLSRRYASAAGDA